MTPNRGKEFALGPRHGGHRRRVLPLRGAPPLGEGVRRERQRPAPGVLPEGADLSRVTGEEVREAYDELNRRPHERLGWLTPWEVLHSEPLHLP